MHRCLPGQRWLVTPGASRSWLAWCDAPRSARGTSGWRIHPPQPIALNARLGIAPRSQSTISIGAAADVSPRAAARHAGQGAVGHPWPMDARVAPGPSGAQPRWFPPPPHLVTPDACRHGSRRHATRRPLPLKWSRLKFIARARRMCRGGAPGLVRKTYRFQPPLRLHSGGQGLQFRCAEDECF